jgi:hypothetical protein
MTTPNQTIITESIMTPITADKVELASLINSAISRNPTKVTISDHISSVFVDKFLEHLTNGFEPIVQSALFLDRGQVDMDKPAAVLEEEHKKIALKVTEKYEKDIASKEEMRKEALKKEQDRIRAERDKLAFEDKILNAKD